MIQIEEFPDIIIKTAYPTILQEILQITRAPKTPFAQLQDQPSQTMLEKTMIKV